MRVEAITLNFNDIDGIYGRYRTVPVPAPYIPGMEVLGVVEAAGGAASRCSVPASPPFRAGRTAATPRLAVAPVAMTFPIPEAIPAPEAGAILMPFHLAALSLYTRAQLVAGETVLIHAAAGGVGSAAVQLARAAGAHVIALAGSAEKARFCRAAGCRRGYRHQRRRLRGRSARSHRRTRRRHRLRHHRRRDHDPHLRLHGVWWATRAGRICVGNRSGRSGHGAPPILFGNFSLVGVCLAYVDDPLAVKQAVGSNFLSRADAEALHSTILDLVDDAARCGPSSASTSPSRSSPPRSTRWNFARRSAGSSCESAGPDLGRHHARVRWPGTALGGLQLVGRTRVVFRCTSPSCGARIPGSYYRRRRLGARIP